MNATVVSGSVPVAFQFSIPLLILGNLTNGNQESANHSDGRATQRLEDRTENLVLPPGYIAYPEVGVAYKLNSSQVTWHEARKRCSSDGGYLAVVDSQPKLDIVRKIMSVDDTTHPWTGVHNFYDSHEWSSVNNGSPVSFFKWWLNHPLDIERAHCIFLIYSNKESKHVNWSCDDLFASLCEIPITKQLKFEVLVRWIP